MGQPATATERDVPRINVQDAYEHVESGEALLVCAYDSREKCEQYKLSGANSLESLSSRESSLQKSDELIFYCA